MYAGAGWRNLAANKPEPEAAYLLNSRRTRWPRSAAFIEHHNSKNKYFTWRRRRRRCRDVLGATLRNATDLSSEL